MIAFANTAGACVVQTSHTVLPCYAMYMKEEEEEEDYKLWPANKSDRSWQSLSNPAKRHSFVSN